MLDTGFAMRLELLVNSRWKGRLLDHYDAVNQQDLGLTEFSCTQIGGTWTAY